MTAAEWLEKLRRLSRVSCPEITCAEAAELAALLARLLPPEAPPALRTATAWRKGMASPNPTGRPKAKP